MPLQFTENRQRGTGLSATTSPRVTFRLSGLVEATQAEAEAGAVTGRYMSPLRTAQYVGSVIRERLTADRTYYVRSDGSDSNTGTSNTSAGAFLTIQKAVNVVCGDLDVNGYVVTIQLQSGVTYTEQVELFPYIGHHEATQNDVVIQGSRSSPSSYIVDGTSGITFVAVNVPTPWRLVGIRIKAATGVSIEADINSTIYIDTVDFPTTTSDHIRCLYNGKVEALADYTISGGASTHIIATAGGQFLIQSGKTVTISNTPAWSSSFVSAALNGVITLTGTTYSGSATGVRWRQATFGSIYWGGTDLDTLPGNSVGVVTPIPVAYGGTGAQTASGARTNLGTQIQHTHGDSNYSPILATDLPVLVTSASLTGARTWTLPAASSVDSGRLFTISDQGGINGANTLTIQRGGSDTFQGIGVSGNAITLSNQFDAITIYSNGVNAWYLVSKTS